MTGLKLFRLIVWGAVAVAGGLFLGLSGLMPGQQRGQPAITSAGIAAIGGPFKLTSHNGEPFDNARLAGKPYLAFFGFTHCPDICPTTLFELTELMTELGAATDRFNVIFITVDPERDTQELLAGYMTSFDERIVALRGTQEETDAVVKAFAAFARKVPLEGGQYTMDHTAGVYLMDAEGKFAGMLDMHEPRKTRLQKLRRLAGGNT
ncbi:MAG: SCO family protein [Pseudolabrys sp.]|nr:SCO family protein [Pseudolabrys sp.]